MVEEQVLRQKSRACWIEIGDANTKYFHDQLKMRTAKNTIASIHTDSGTKITDPKEVEAEFIGTFTTLMDACAEEFPYPNSEVIKAGPCLTRE